MLAMDCFRPGDWGVWFESSHRTEPGFQPAMVGFDGIVGILLDDMQRRRGVLVDHAGIGGRPVSGDLDRPHADGERTSEEGPGSR